MTNTVAFQIARKVFDLLPATLAAAGISADVLFARPDAVKVEPTFSRWINVRPQQIGIMSNPQPSTIGRIDHGIVLGLDLCARADFDSYWQIADELWVAIHPLMNTALKLAMPTTIVNVMYQGLAALQIEDNGGRVQVCLPAQYLVFFRTHENALESPFA